MEAERETKRLKWEAPDSAPGLGTSENVGTMSSVNSLRPEDRMSSELEGSEGVLTEMTSVSEADVVMAGMNEDKQGGEEEERVFSGGASIYAPTAFTRGPGQPQVLIRIVGEGGEDESIDLYVKIWLPARLFAEHSHIETRRPGPLWKDTLTTVTSTAGATAANTSCPTTSSSKHDNTSFIKSSSTSSTANPPPYPSTTRPRSSTSGPAPATGPP